MEKDGHESAPLSQNQKEFLTLQFGALRKEILDLRSRVVKLLSLGISGIPILVGAGEKFSLDLVIYAGPLITVVVMLMLLYEQNSIMRAGRFIRLHIEPRFAGDVDFVCWERFLELTTYNRRAEQLFSYASYSTFALYYLGSTFFAYTLLTRTFGETTGVLVTSVYLGLFLVALFVVIRNFPIGTTRPEDARQA